MLEEEGECAVAAHRVACDGDAGGVERGEGGEEEGGKLGCYVGFHLVVGAVEGGCCVYVEASVIVCQLCSVVWRGEKERTLQYRSPRNLLILLS